MINPSRYDPSLHHPASLQPQVEADKKAEKASISVDEFRKMSFSDVLKVSLNPNITSKQLFEAVLMAYKEIKKDDSKLAHLLLTAAVATEPNTTTLTSMINLFIYNEHFKSFSPQDKLPFLEELISARKFVLSDEFNLIKKIL